MAKLRIEIEENEFALYDVTTYVNDELRSHEENFTSEAAAYNAALLKAGVS